MNDYTKYKKKKIGIVYAVDFDGTLCESNFPTIIRPKKAMINFCKKAQARGDKLILWTCRENQDLKEAVDFCKLYGLEFDAINCNLQQRIDEWGTDPRKIGADVYIDDLSILPVIQVVKGFFRG